MTRSLPFAVFTGDIVDSSSLAAKDLGAACDVVAHAFMAAGDWRRGAVRGEADFYRGDAWQAVSATPGLALRVALFVRARLIGLTGVDTRIALTIGPVETVSRKRISLSRGPAFTASGRLIEDMGPSRFAIRLVDPGRGVKNAAGFIDAVASLIDAIVGGWTARQAEVVSMAILPTRPRQDDLAAVLGVTKQAVSKILDAADWRALEDALDAFENADWSL